MKLVPAAEVGEADLAAAEAILDDAFPPELRSPFASLLQDDLLILMNDAPAGLAVVRPLGETGWVFLRYLAIGQRGGGLGSQMWPLLLERYAAAGFDRLLLDVEHPDEPGIDEAERSIRERRIGFYERLGVTLLPVSDYRPPHGGEPLLMRLLATTTGDGELPTDPASVREMVHGVYLHRYGLTADDPIVRQTAIG